MINALILATFVFTALYISAALVAHFHDCWMVCGRRHHKAMIAQTVSKTVEAIATVEPEEVAPVIELPKKITIRSLRDFVRSHELQTRVKEIAGKSVSKLTKDELHQAVTMAIA